MKNLIKYTLFLLVTLNQSCKKCDECFTPPEPFLFEIVDKSTGENLFKNGTYKSSDIEVIDSLNHQNVKFAFLDENDLNLIQINTIGWKTEKIHFQFKISNQNIFNLLVDAERVSQDCCSFTRYNDVKITNAEFELDSMTEIYQILVEL